MGSLLRNAFRPVTTTLLVNTTTPLPQVCSSKTDAPLPARVIGPVPNELVNVEPGTSGNDQRIWPRLVIIVPPLCAGFTVPLV